MKCARIEKICIKTTKLERIEKKNHLKNTVFIRNFVYFRSFVCFTRTFVYFSPTIIRSKQKKPKKIFVNVKNKSKPPKPI